MNDETQRRVSVVAINDAPLARQALTFMLSDPDNPDIDLRATYSSADEAIAGIERNPPHVALIDLHLGNQLREGVALIRRIRQVSPSTACLVMTASDPAPQVLSEVVVNGAAGYYRQGYLRGGTLPALIKQVVAGETDISQSLAAELLALHVRAQDPGVPALPPHLRPAPLSEWELNLLNRAAAGQSSTDIGEDLRVSVGRIRRTFRNIVSKFHMHL